MKNKLFLTLSALMLSFAAAAQQTTFPTTQMAPTETNTLTTAEQMIVRLAEIEVHPQYLSEYLRYANEVDRLSMEREKGVVCLFPMQSEDNPTQIRILEIYASQEAYQSHINTDHFQRYKQSTLHMVKSLKLPNMTPLDPAAMQLIFRKLKH